MSISRRFTLAAVAAASLATFGSAALAQAKMKVAAIYTVPVEQQWVSRIDKALKAAVARGEIEYVFSEKVANADYERVMREYAEKGNTLIVGESFAVEAAARKVAKDYPKVSFLMGSSGKAAGAQLQRLRQLHPGACLPHRPDRRRHEQEQQDRPAGGYPIPEVNRLMNAFMAGAKETNPKAEFMVTFINSWFDPPKAKEAAFAMIDKGADVMYAERFGVSDAAKERKVLAIGNVIDTQKDYPDTVVASALWNMEPTIDRALKAVKEGKFKAEDYGQYSMMKFKGSELAPGHLRQQDPQGHQGQGGAAPEGDPEGKFTVKVDDNQPKPTARPAGK